MSEIRTPISNRRDECFVTSSLPPFESTSGRTRAFCSREGSTPPRWRTSRPSSRCFTGCYRGEAYDERRWARLIADQGREWHEIEITPQDFIDHFDEMVEKIGPPTEGPGTFGQYMVSRYVSQHVSTILSGRGRGRALRGIRTASHRGGRTAA